MSVVQSYMRTAHQLLERIEKTQATAIETAAEAVAAAMLNKCAIHCAGLGHGIAGDFINRAGGLAAVLAFSHKFEISDPVPACLKQRPDDKPIDREIEAVRLAVHAGNLRRGDVMLVGSVSGRTSGQVELALACLERGLTVIAFTSLEYSARTPSLHPSGKRLNEAATVVIDLCVPYGDACVDVPGLAIKAIPLSGLATLVAGWMLWGRVMERMAAAGTPPTVFISVNREGGKASYDKMIEQFNARGY